MNRIAPILALLCLACDGAPLDVAPPPPRARPDVTPRDAGSVDARSRDAGTKNEADAGAAPDASSPRDAGAAPDAGIEGPAPDDCITDTSPGRRAFACDGLTYHVSVPTRCAAPGCAVVFDVHGFTMSGVMQENNTNLAALAEGTDFIVVQPSATPAPPASNWSARSDDARVFDFMMRVVRVFRADAARLHITGFSDGGWLTWRFVCEHADVLASAAPAAASGYCSVERACDFVEGELPARKIPLLFMLGTQDAYVEFACAQEQITAVASAWSLMSEGVVEEGAGYRLERYSDAAGLPFEVLVHDYASDASVPLIPDLVGHCYPGSEDPGDEDGQIFPFGCAPPNAFHWGARVLDFFTRTGTR